ncbi:hypothetical protein SEPCBS57363_003919 [Sporothrix epigloea]|uniref:Sequence orphan n=1 Tax=Sporothrix epigloea TaxID=1892477 RepID=A0ABP0DP64_9PEZI
MAPSATAPVLMPVTLSVPDTNFEKTSRLSRTTLASSPSVVTLGLSTPASVETPGQTTFSSLPSSSSSSSYFPHASSPSQPLSAPSTSSKPLSTLPPTILAASPFSDPTNAPASSSLPQRNTLRNTRHLGLRLAADAASGFTAASLVAPIIAIIDRSIMENASGANTLAGSLRSSFTTLFRHPQQILLGKPFFLICLLYGGTYFTANVIDTASSTAHNRPASHVTAGAAKFAASSATNIGLCIYKDQVFVRMFGPPGAIPRPVPLPSYMLFALRDCMTIFASFNIPPRLGPWLNERFGMGDASATNALLRNLSGQTVAQFAAPALTQFVSTPVHLLGLDLYNRAWQKAGTSNGSGPATWSDRFAAVRKISFASSVARIGRIVPAYGIGGVVNMKMRKLLMTRLE